MKQLMDDDLLGSLRYCADCERRGWRVRANLVAPCMRAGLVKARHQEWGVYRVQLTEKGRRALAESGEVKL